MEKEGIEERTTKQSRGERGLQVNKSDRMVN